MALKWWGSEDGRSPSAGSLSIRPGRICRFTGPPQNPNTATFLISQGSRAAAPQHDPPQQSQHPGGATAHSERKSSARGGHPSAALHTGLGRRSKTQASRDPNAATVSEPSAGAAATARSAAQPRKPGEEATPGLGEHLRRRWHSGLVGTPSPTAVYTRRGSIGCHYHTTALQPCPLLGRMRPTRLLTNLMVSPPISDGRGRAPHHPGLGGTPRPPVLDAGGPKSGARAAWS